MTGFCTAQSIDEKPDLIVLATLVFYTDVGCFQYIAKVGLVSKSPFCSFLVSDTHQGQTFMGCQCCKLLAHLLGSLDFCCHDLLGVHVAHQDVDPDAVPSIVSHRKLQILVVDVCVLHCRIWSGGHLLESLCLCACQS